MRKTTTVLLVMLASACGDSESTELDPALAVDVTTLSCAAAATACGPTSVALASFGSTHEVETLLAGAWRFCGDHEVLRAGVELTPIHEVFVLEQAADGSCRRATTAPAGDWYTIDISEQNPPGTYQLVLDWHGATMSLVPRFSKKAMAFHDGFFGFDFRRLH